jgi:hypothetical protein
MPQEQGITEITNSRGGAKGVLILVLPWLKLKAQPKKFQNKKKERTFHK